MSNNGLFLFRQKSIPNQLFNEVKILWQRQNFILYILLSEGYKTYLQSLIHTAPLMAVPKSDLFDNNV